MALKEHQTDLLNSGSWESEFLLLSEKTQMACFIRLLNNIPIKSYKTYRSGGKNTQFHLCARIPHYFHMYCPWNYSTVNDFETLAETGTWLSCEKNHLIQHCKLCLISAWIQPGEIIIIIKGLSTNFANCSGGLTWLLRILVCVCRETHLQLHGDVVETLGGQRILQRRPGQ